MNRFNFVHLNVHSHYSIMDGCASIEELVDAAIKDRMPGIAITDNGNMSGVMELFDYATRINNERKLEGKKPFKPIIGCELYVSRHGSKEHKDGIKDMKGYHLLVLAKNLIGYRNLIKIVSNAWTEGYYMNPRTDRMDLEKYHEGLIVLSGGFGSEVHAKIAKNDMAGLDETIEWYKQTFADDYYLEVQRNIEQNINKDNPSNPTLELQSTNAILLEKAKEHGVKVVATNDVHYIKQRDSEAYCIQQCETTGKTLDEFNSEMPSSSRWLRSRKEMCTLFADIPEAIASTTEIYNKAEIYDIHHTPLVPSIEIPQEFYDKVQAEEEEKKRLEQEKKEQDEMLKKNSALNAGLFGMSIVNAILLSIVVYYLLSKSEIVLVGVLMYVIVGALFGAIKNKKESSFAATFLMGSILSAILFFSISMLKGGNEDYIHYSMVCGAIAIIGFILSSIITFAISNYKNIKAMQTIGIILVLVAIIGGPVYFYKKYPEQFYKYVMNQQKTIIATSDREYVEKTLKNRYGLDFSCPTKKTVNNVQGYVTKRWTCTDASNKSFNVESVAYDESKILYVVRDRYLSDMYLTSLKNNLKEKVGLAVNGKVGYDKATDVDNGTIGVALYPKKNWCDFIGDCHDCDEYQSVKVAENKIDKQFEYSKNLDLKEYLNMDSKSFVNKYEFKYIIEVIITNSFEMLSYDEYVDKVLEVLNNEGYQNTSGFEVILKIQMDGIILPKYKVVGKASSNGMFQDYEVVETDM